MAFLSLVKSINFYNNVETTAYLHSEKLKQYQDSKIRNIYSKSTLY